jgi:hypothetical protein
MVSGLPDPKRNNLLRSSRPVLVIIDDLANQLFANEEIATLFLMQSHHENVRHVDNNKD